MCIHRNKEGLIIDVFVQPRSSKNEVVGKHGDALKIKFTAAPVDGKANAMCIEFLSEVLNTPKRSIEIISGLTTRKKRIRIRLEKGSIEDKDLDRIQNRLMTLLSK
ncbi:MAG: YggU family protein [Desulfobacterales bacterium]|nr:YggU family protein [Desulfobacterales bacterium]